MSLAALVLAATAALAEPPPASAAFAGGPEPRKRITVLRVERGPEIDGRLDDAVWAQAAMFDDFVQLEPSPGGRPSQRTEVRVLHDADHLYIGIRMFDEEPARIIANQLQQGQAVFNDDHVQILLDPLDSGRRSYMLYVNPNSVQRDGLSFANDRWNMNWDGIWHARSRIDESGWSTEIAIPFRTLSFDPGRRDWGITVLRGIARNGETKAWTHRDFRLSNDALGVIAGFEEINQGLGLDVIPSLVLRERRDYLTGRSDTALEPSLDLFYRFTPSLIGALTVNTDFSATEVDARQVNLTRFSLFFPEKREFFLQDADIFEFADLAQNGRPFFSRTIGLSAAGQPVDLVAGAKLTGRVGRWNLGLLGVRQDEDAAVEADTLLVARASADVLQASSVGVIATYGDPRSNLDSWLVGGDWNYRNLTWLSGRVVEAGAWVQQSRTEGLEGDDRAWGVRFALPNDRVELRGSMVELQRNFRPAMGFVNRRDIRQYDGTLYRRWREPTAALRALRVGMEVQQITDLDGRLESSLLRAVPVDLVFSRGDALNVYALRQRESLAQAFLLGGVLPVPAGVYIFERAGVKFTGAGYRRFTPVLRVETGEFYDGHRDDLELSASWSANRHLLLEAAWSANRLSLDSGDFITRLMSLRANVAFNVQWAWTNTLQYDNLTNQFGYSTRLRWVPRLGQALTIALNHDFDVDDERRLSSLRREFSSRVAYTYRF